jgi:hypothetical protein
MTGERYRTLSASDLPERMSRTLKFSKVCQRNLILILAILESYHWVREGGNASIYGCTILAYISGVSCTIMIVCFVYCKTN